MISVTFLLSVPLSGCYTNILEPSQLERRTILNQDGSPEKMFSVYLTRDGEEIRHGVVKEFYPNGTIRALYNFRHGNLDGLCTLWYANGKVEQIATYSCGKPDGYYIVYNPEGREVSRLLLKKGKPVNGSIHVISFGLNGTKWSFIRRFKMGRVVGEEECDEYGNKVVQRIDSSGLMEKSRKK